MGVSLDRVKSLTSGKVKNLKREESEALIKKLHIRGDWLATGEGPMLQSEGERELGRRMDLLKLATGKAQIEGLEPHHTRALQEILFYAELGDAEALRRALTQMQPDEVALVRSYRSCSEDAKVRLIQQAALLSGRKRTSAPSPIWSTGMRPLGLTVARNSGVRVSPLMISYWRSSSGKPSNAAVSLIL